MLLTATDCASEWAFGVVTIRVGEAGVKGDKVAGGVPVEVDMAPGGVLGEVGTPPDGGVDGVPLDALVPVGVVVVPALVFASGWGAAASHVDWAAYSDCPGLPDPRGSPIEGARSKRAVPMG